MCRRVFPNNQINRIRYFTARVQPWDRDPKKPERQNLFIRALLTIPNLSVHYGQFRSHPRDRPLVNPSQGQPRTARVLYTEEKGSDVNLATYLLLDGFRGEYEVAIVVSNDSDLVEPVRVVKDELGLAVGILNPQRNRGKTAWELMKAASFYRRIRTSTLKACQFPPTLEDVTGVFTKPKEW